MKLFDLIKSKIAKIPLFSSRTSFISSVSSFLSRRKGKYFTSWVYVAVTIISENVGQIRFKLFKEDAKGNVEQIFKHPALDLLKKANGYMTQYTIFERMQANLELCGNEFWFLTKNAAGQPDLILPLKPSSVTPVPSTEEGATDYVKGYIYKVDGKVFKIPTDNIIQFKNFNPDSDIVGMSTLEAAMDAADTDLFTRTYNKNFFLNSARPDIILEFPEVLTSEQETRLIEAWKSNHGGPQKQFKTAVASGGLKIKSFQLSQRDMEYLEGRKFNRDEIMTVFRVPLAVAGFTGNETFASAKAATYAFGARTIDPKMFKANDTLNEFYLPLFANTEGMFLVYDSPILEDRELKLKEYDNGMKNRWLSTNDIRRAENLPEIQGGDTVMGPFNLQPIGDPVESKSFSDDPVSKIVSISKSIAKKITDSFKENEGVKIKTKKDIEDEAKKKEDEAAFDRKGEFMVKQRDERGLTFENQFNIILTQLWEGQKQRAINNLVARLNQKDWKTKALSPIDTEFEVSTTINLFTPLMTELTQVEGEAAAEFLGLDEFVLSPNLTKFIEENIKLLAKELTDTTTKRVRTEIASGIEAGEAIVDLEKRITESTAFSAARAENIARTETIRAQSKAQVEVWKDSGVVVEKIWYTALDERVCPNCDAMHGKTISLNTAFFPKGETISNGGVTLNLDYEDVTGPPLHPQCRCVLIPVVK